MPGLARFASMAGIASLIVFPIAALYLAGPAGSLIWIDNYGIQILLHVMLGWDLNIVVGLAGLLDLGYVSFYAAGAYSHALLSTFDPVQYRMLVVGIAMVVVMNWKPRSLIASYTLYFGLSQLGTRRTAIK